MVAQKPGRIHYGRLSSLARATIQDYGLSVAEYVRWAGWNDGDWHGDRCGCTDDRCKGFHHDEHEDCGCLPVLVAEALGWTYPQFHEATHGFPSLHNGGCLGMVYRGPGGGCRQCGWRPVSAGSDAGLTA
jgi:hypothetical protein